MGRARFFAFLTATAVVAVLAGGARAEPGDDFVGTWEGEGGGFKETWTIARDKGAWTVTGTFQSGGTEVGSFRAANVRLTGNTLSFRQDYIVKPRPNWSSGNQMTAQVSGDKLNVTWRAGKQSGKTTLTRKGMDTVDKKDPPKKLSEEAQKELRKLEGKWQFRNFVLDGKTIEFGATWQFKGETVAESIGTPRRSGTVKVDPDRKPKEIDVNFTRSEGGGQKGLFKGVYELDGDKLTICVGTDGKRATELESKADSKTMLIVFQRSK